MSRRSCISVAMAILIAVQPLANAAADVARRALSVNDSVQVVAARDYVEAARTALMESLRSREGRFELRASGRYRDVSLQGTSGVTWQVRVANPEVSAGAIVWVDILAGDRIRRHIPVHFQVQWFKPALVAKHRLPARTALTAQMFEQREVDIAPLRGAAAESFAQLLGKRLRRELDANGVLALDAIEERPPVEAGEQILVTANVGRVVVQTTAIAQRDGYAGQSIVARLRNGRETLRVEVVGEDQAKVQGDG